MVIKCFFTVDLVYKYILTPFKFLVTNVVDCTVFFWLCSFSSYSYCGDVLLHSPGWGKIKHPGSSYNILQQAMMPPIDNAKCKQKIQAAGGMFESGYHLPPHFNGEIVLRCPNQHSATALITLAYGRLKQYKLQPI